MSITLLKSISSKRGGILDIQAYWLLPIFYNHSPKQVILMNMGCIKSKNMVVEFNRQVKEIVIKLITELLAATMTCVDVYAATYEFTSDVK